MAELELVLQYHVGTFTGGGGDDAIIAGTVTYADAAKAAARFVLADGGSQAALKLRYADLFRFRTVLEISQFDGSGTLTMETRIGAVTESEVVGSSASMYALIAEIQAAWAEISVPGGWSPTASLTRVRSY